MLFDGVEELDAIEPWEVLAHRAQTHPEDGYAVDCRSPVTVPIGLAVFPDDLTPPASGPSA